jgi:hypothetical protein
MSSSATIVRTTHRSEGSHYRIGHLAKRYGVSTEAIRQWEQRGLIPPAHRTPGGHRRYGEAHRQALDKLILPAGPVDF